jgi:hypothetical protein
MTGEAPEVRNLGKPITSSRVVIPAIATAPRDFSIMLVSSPSLLAAVDCY